MALQFHEGLWTPERRESMHISRGTGYKIKTELYLMKIRQGNSLVYFIPSLNLSGYGDTPEEAKSMLMEVIDDYFQALTSMKADEMEAHLAKMGWKHERFAKKQFNGPYIDKDGVLQLFEIPIENVSEGSLISV